MNNCIFTTHETLSDVHVGYSLESLFTWQDEHTVEWDNFIVYNTHEHEISSEIITAWIQEIDVHEQVKNLFVFPYEAGAYPKTLTQNTLNHFQMLVENELNDAGKTLLLKADYCLSSNFNRVFSEHSSVNNIWTLPIFNAKQKVGIDEIKKKLTAPTFVYVDHETYYRGGTNHPVTPGTLDNMFEERSPSPDITTETDPRIRFVSHNIQNDYNVHVFSNDILNLGYQICRDYYNVHSTWGGANELFHQSFGKAGVTRSTEIQAYAVHMYHGIISPNREQDRTDPRKVIDGERY